MAIVYETYASGTTPAMGDTKRMLLVKLALSASGLGVQIYSGSGSPVGVVTPTSAVAVYFDTDDGTQYNWYSSAWH